MEQQQQQYEQQQQQQQQRRPPLLPTPIHPGNATGPRVASAVAPEPQFRALDFRVREAGVPVIRDRLDAPSAPADPIPIPAPTPPLPPPVGKKRKRESEIQTRKVKSVNQISKDLKRMKTDVEDAERQYREKRKQIMDLHRKLESVPTRSPLSRVYNSDPLGLNSLNFSQSGPSDNAAAESAPAAASRPSSPAPKAAAVASEPGCAHPDPPTCKAFRGSVARRPANRGDRQPPPPPSSPTPPPPVARRRLRGQARAAARAGITIDEYRRRRRDSEEKREKEEEEEKKKQDELE